MALALSLRGCLLAGAAARAAPSRPPAAVARLRIGLRDRGAPARAGRHQRRLRDAGVGRDRPDLVGDAVDRMRQRLAQHPEPGALVGLRHHRGIDRAAQPGGRSRRTRRSAGRRIPTRRAVAAGLPARIGLTPESPSKSTTPSA